MKEIYYDFPSIGESILYVFKCNDCGYKTSEIIPIKEGDPTTLNIIVDSEEKLRKLILKSPYAKIILKEIDLEIYPGIESKFEIIPIDDLINRIKENLSSFKYLYDEKEKIDAINQKINYLEEVLRNNKTLTIIIEDEKGYSKIY
ncbi:MAG: hypothetical protein ACP5G1_01100 [Nanopusillaceae archaeon]